MEEFPPLCDCLFDCVSNAVIRLFSKHFNSKMLFVFTKQVAFSKAINRLLALDILCFKRKKTTNVCYLSSKVRIYNFKYILTLNI